MSIFENDPERHKRFDELVNWSKKCLDIIDKEDLSIELKDEPGLPYIMAMCSRICMSNPILAMHIGNLVSEWLLISLSKNEFTDKLLAFHCFEGFSIMAKSFSAMTSVQMNTFYKIFNGLSLVASAMIHGPSAHSDILTNEIYDKTIENFEKAAGIIKLMKEAKHGK